jgi:hypothetical protein
MPRSETGTLSCHKINGRSDVSNNDKKPFMHLLRMGIIIPNSKEE